MKICVILPIWGRHSLLAWSLDRLLSKGYKVVVVGHEEQARDLVDVMGADWVYHPNFPLGMKFNEGWEYAMRKHQCDYYLMGNVSDWYSDTYINGLVSQIGDGMAIGTSEKWYYNIGKWGNRLCRYRGDDVVSSGLMLSRNGLVDLGGRPFNDVMDSDLDWSIIDNLKGKVIRYKGDGKVLSISFHKWINSYSFDGYWNNKMMCDQFSDGRDWLKEHFRDALEMTLW